MATLNAQPKNNAAVPYDNGGEQWHQPPNPFNPNNQSTGGTGYSTTVSTAANTGGGGYKFPTATATTTGTNAPVTDAIPMPKPTFQQPIASTAGPTSIYGNTQTGIYTPVADEAAITQGYLDQFLNSNNALMRNARISGVEQAAVSGLQNSSIAAGASQRAALDVAVPLTQLALDTFNQREQRQWQSGEAQLDRELTTSEREAVQAWQSGEAQLTREQEVLLANMQEEMNQAQRAWTSGQNQLDRDQQITMSQVQNWLNNETFMREFNAQLALLPVQNSAQLMNYIAQQAITNPEIYTQDIISGMSEFFTTNFLDVMSRYFPSLYTQSNAGGA